MIVLDASILIAHFYPHDAHHAKATEFLICAIEDMLVIHRLTMSEVLVGAAKVGRAEELLTDLRAGGVRIAAATDDEILGRAVLSAETRLKLPDSSVLYLARANGAAIATFDKALAKAALNLGVPLAID